MDTLLRFGSGDQLYTFTPSDQIQLRDNFRNAVPRTTRLPGLSGGFDEYGASIAPAEVGNVSVTFGYEATSNADMLTKKRAIGNMKAFGRKRLYKQPLDDSADEVYCEARVNAIEFNEAVGTRPERYQTFTINFQVDNPYWFTQGTEAPQYGDGSIFGSGVTYGGSPVEESLVGADNSFTVTPSGNDITYPRITLTVPATKSASNIRIQRLVNGSVIDQLRYAGTLDAGDMLEINCRSYAVFLNGDDGYTSDYSFNTASWFRLIGGTDNSVRVLMDEATDEIDIQLRYYEAYNV
ncbi:MAG: phage distal tail protein [Anaerolineae bacterium]